MKKLYVIQKFVVASSIKEALKIEKNFKVDEIFLDDDWKKAHKPEIQESKTGFIHATKTTKTI